jgi:hypothetical protein
MDTQYHISYSEQKEIFAATSAPEDKPQIFTSYKETTINSYNKEKHNTKKKFSVACLAAETATSLPQNALPHLRLARKCCRYPRGSAINATCTTKAFMPSVRRQPFLKAV